MIQQQKRWRQWTDYDTSRAMDKSFAARSLARQRAAGGPAVREGHLRGLGCGLCSCLGRGWEACAGTLPFKYRFQPIHWRLRACGHEVGMSRLPALLRAPPNPPSGFPGGMPLAAHVFAACLEQRAYVNGSVRRQAWWRSRQARPSAASRVTCISP